MGTKKFLVGILTMLQASIKFHLIATMGHVYKPYGLVAWSDFHITRN